MIRPKPRDAVRPPFGPRPRITRRYEASVTGSYPIEFHEDGCRCRACAAPAPTGAADTVEPPLPIVRLTFAAIATANAVAFALDPAGSWTTLRTAVLHLLGMR